MSRAYCEDCYHYDYESYFGTDCLHPDNRQVALKGNWRKREYGHMWYCYKKNENNNCELYLDKREERDRKSIFKRIGRKIRG